LRVLLAQRKNEQARTLMRQRIGLASWKEAVG
jgi:hypothetical protein